MPEVLGDGGLGEGPSFKKGLPPKMHFHRTRLSIGASHTSEERSAVSFSLSRFCANICLGLDDDRAFQWSIRTSLDMVVVSFQGGETKRGDSGPPHAFFMTCITVEKQGCPLLGATLLLRPSRISALVSEVHTGP